MPTADTKVMAMQRTAKTRAFAGRRFLVRPIVAAGGMSSVAGMRAGALVRRALSLCALIVALCATGGADPLSAQTTTKPDLSGRWTSAKGTYVLDITRCGEGWCGIRLKPDQTCGALALRLSARAEATSPHRLEGTLNLEPAMQNYRVTATAKPLDAARPTELHVFGAPETSGLPTRIIPFVDQLVRGPEAICRHDNKVS